MPPCDPGKCPGDDNEDKGCEASSAHPIQCFTGQIIHQEVDLETQGHGLNWGQTRTYANRVDVVAGEEPGWRVRELKHLEFPNHTGSLPPAYVVVKDGSTTQEWFARQGSEAPWNYLNEYYSFKTLTYKETLNEFWYADKDGNVWVFADHTATSGGAGRLLRVLDAAGRECTLGFSGNLLTSFQQGTGAEAVRYEYEYDGSVLIKVTLKVGGVPVRRVCYSYYGTSEEGGNEGDLSLALVEHYNAESQSWSALRRSHYRYYIKESPENNGCLWLILGPNACEKLIEAGLNPLAATNSQAQAYADYAFEYEAVANPATWPTKYDFWVNKESLRGGQEVYEFSYLRGGGSDAGFPSLRCVETRPDQSQVVTYFDPSGELLSKVIRNASGVTVKREIQQYLGKFRMFRIHDSAIESYVDYADTGGFGFNFTPAEAGSVDFWLYIGFTSGPASAMDRVWMRGIYTWDESAQSHIYVFKQKFDYEEHVVEGVPIAKVKTQFDYSDLVAFTAAQIGSGILVDPVVMGPIDAAAAKTSWDYEYFTDSFRVSQEVKTLPVVPVAQHGVSDDLFQETRIFNEDGNPVWECTPRGVIIHRSYSPTTGALMERTDDVKTSTWAGSDPVPSEWSTPSGLGLNLVTTYVRDVLGRVTAEYGPEDYLQIRTTDTQAEPTRRVAMTVYNDVAHEVRTAQGYSVSRPGLVEVGTLGAVTVIRMNAAGQVVEESACPRASNEGWLTAAESLPREKWSRWSVTLRDFWGRLIGTRAYFDIPATGQGTKDVHYLETTTGYDNMGREIRLVNEAGDIERRVYDTQGLLLSVWAGTDDTGATASAPGGAGLPNNMRKLRSHSYADATSTPPGDGVLVETRLHVDDTPANDRVTTYAYDFQDRLIRATSHDGVRNVIQVTTYDERDRPVTQETYQINETAGNLLTRKVHLYDRWNRIYKTSFYGAGGAHEMVGLNWYDPAGNVVKSSEPGKTAFTKNVYDGMNRLRASYFCCVPGTGGVPAGNSNSVNSDTVFEQTLWVLNRMGDVTAKSLYRRLDDTAGAGPLQGPTAAQCAARITWQTFYTDPIGRPRAEADWGTRGGQSFVSDLGQVYQPEWVLVPERSDLVLVTTRHYKDDGEANAIVDPMGIETRWENDKLGRRMRLFEGLQGGPACQAASTSAPRVTEYTWHASGQMLTLTQINAETGDQITRWVFGTSLSESELASWSLLRAKIYPESDDQPSPLGNGPDGIYARLEYTYNRQGEPVSFKDADGTVHEYSYDKAGRQTDDRVTTLASALDGSVRRLQFQYDARGLLTKATSHSAPTGGSIVNEVQRAYDAHGRLITDYQSHAGAVNTGSTPATGYTYVSNRLRRTSITYPNDRVVNLTYGSANSADEHLNRPAAQRVQGETNDFTLYTWAGEAWPVEVRYPAANLQLTLKRQSGDPVGDAGDIYAGYDRFGRTVDLRWRLFSTGAHRERVQYGFDRNSRRTWRRRVEVDGWDSAYHYDSLGQMQEEARGDLNLNQTAIGGIPGNRWRRRYDPTGNWRQVEIDKVGGRWSLEDRVHDKGNRLMQVDQHEQSQQPPVEVDAAGRMTKVPLAPGNWTNVSNEVKWDAWNRIVEVQFSASVTGAYAYDALHRRIKRTASGVTWHSYFNDAWKVIEERRASHPTVAAAHYLWGLRHRDDLARRDRATTAGGSMSQRHYVLMDYHNPVAITGTTGTVQERYQFDGFGTRVVLDAGNTPISASAYAWSFAFQGQFEDGETGWLNYGFRYYAPGLGRFLSKDPIMEAGGNNLYRMSNNAPVNVVDWLGLSDCGSSQWLNQVARSMAIEAAERDRQSGYEHGIFKGALRKEFCGWICCSKETGVYATGPIAGKDGGNCNPDLAPCDEGDKHVRIYHSHFESHLPSGNDYLKLNPEEGNQGNNICSYSDPSKVVDGSNSRTTQIDKELDQKGRPQPMPKYTNPDGSTRPINKSEFPRDHDLYGRLR